MSMPTELAKTIGVSSRTVRRAISEKVIRARRYGPRRYSIPSKEVKYLLSHWGLLSPLRQALRSESIVRAAILFGSVARGSSHPGSDLDILIVPSRELENHDLIALADRLEYKSGQRIDLHQLSDVEDNLIRFAPILIDGRPILDRDGWWPRLKSRQERVVTGARTLKDKQIEYIRAANEGLAK